MKELALLAMNETKDVVLLTDLDTHALLYINPAGMTQFQIPSDLDYSGQPCYRVLRGLDDFCPMCPLGKLRHDRFFDWEYYNPKVGRQFRAQGKLIEFKGRTVHFEMAYDVTELYDANLELQRRLHHDQALLDCIQTLALGTDHSQSLIQLLEKVCKYYEGERAYIFELDARKEHLKLSHEWCASGAPTHRDIIPSVPMEELSPWMTQFHTEAERILPDLYHISAQPPEIQRLLREHHITSLISAPLLLDGQIIGFCGVDQPKQIELGVELLRSVAVFMAADLGKRRMSKQMDRLTYEDSLTNTGNRWAFLASLQHLEEDPPRSLGMVFLDLNGLRVANVSKGRSYGDYLLRHTGDTLRTLFERQVYRVGGDEFTILCPNVTRQDFEGQLSLLIQVLRRDRELSVSVGSIWREGDAVDIEEMSSMSEELMHPDKQSYYRSRSEGSGDYLDTITHILLDELSRGEFFLYLQPKVDILTGQLMGAEALVRRRDAEGGTIPPVRFIPLYESEGIIRHLDLFVLDSVCALLAQWQAEGLLTPPIISINCSRVTMSEEGIVQEMQAICARHGISPHQIMVEVTERIGSLAQDELRVLMSQLIAAGFRISLDDFGAEYSNLALLSMVGFDEIKLDKSLVDHLEHSASSRTVVGHVISMCRELGGALIVAEGVETQGQKDLLLEYCCRVGQGYLFSRPMPVEEFCQKYIFTFME